MNKKFIIILTSIVCLLPIILALALYDELPDNVAMQYNLEGNPTWYAPKAFAVFGLPLSLMAVNIITLLILFNDPKRKNISKKMITITQWIIPVTSLIVIPMLLITAIGISLPVTLIAFSFCGLLFIITGNYLPKCKHNYSVGIKIPWTLNDEENWNKTHRMSGYLWMIGGVIFIIFGFLPLKNVTGLIILFSFIGAITTVPILYSYSLYKKKSVITNTGEENEKSN